MKTSLKTLFASALTGVLLVSSAFTSVAVGKNPGSPIISPLIDYNKVIISGNVKVVLIQSKIQRVVMYEDHNKETTAVVQKGNNLYISSTERQPVNIVVYIKDLHRIDACNKASVTTRGKFTSQALQVFLKDGATAFINGDTESLYTVIKDNSELRLRGSSKDHVLVKGKSAKLNVSSFAALKTTATSLDGQALPADYSIILPKDTVVAENRIR